MGKKEFEITKSFAEVINIAMNVKDAIYCALKYHDDFEQAMIAAVNHDGDSDSTGAVAGNILGASLGMTGIPNKFIKNLELKDVIIKMAEDLAK